MDTPPTVRDAAASDIPALTAVKGAGSEALHRDRLLYAQGSGFRYLILEANGQVIGCACLVYRRPTAWSDADDTEHLPQIVDLQIHQAWRGKGHGTRFIHAIEEIASQAHHHLYLSVEPLDNPRAYALYLRLGYQPLQTEPYRASWHFTDSAGIEHHGEDWVIDMVKAI